MKYIIAYMTVLIMAVAEIAIINNRYYKEKCKNKYQYFIPDTAYLKVLIPFLIGMTIIYSLCFIKKNAMSLEVMIRWSVLLCSCCVIAFIDIKEHKIPNKIILFLLAARVGFMVYETIQNPDFLDYMVWYPLLGALVGAALMLLAMVVSRKGIGMGDVKLIFIIGFYVSSYELISTMFLIFFASAVYGIVVLALKKVTLHDVMPLAPFALVGVMVKYLLICYGG